MYEHRHIALVRQNGISAKNECAHLSFKLEKRGNQVKFSLGKVVGDNKFELEVKQVKINRNTI